MTNDELAEATELSNRAKALATALDAVRFAVTATDAVKIAEPFLPAGVNKSIRDLLLAEMQTQVTQAAKAFQGFAPKVTP